MVEQSWERWTTVIEQPVDEELWQSSLVMNNCDGQQQECDTRRGEGLDEEQISATDSQNVLESEELPQP